MPYLELCHRATILALFALASYPHRNVWGTSPHQKRRIRKFRQGLWHRHECLEEVGNERWRGGHCTSQHVNASRLVDTEKETQSAQAVVYSICTMYLLAKSYEMNANAAHLVGEVSIHPCWAQAIQRDMLSTCGRRKPLHVMNMFRIATTDEGVRGSYASSIRWASASYPQVVRIISQRLDHGIKWIQNMLKEVPILGVSACRSVHDHECFCNDALEGQFRSNQLT